VNIVVFRGGPLDGQWAVIEGGVSVVAPCPLKQAWDPIRTVTYRDVARYQIAYTSDHELPATVRVMETEEVCS
jgi:hypothetical protein